MDRQPHRQSLAGKPGVPLKRRFAAHIPGRGLAPLALLALALPALSQVPAQPRPVAPTRQIAPETAQRLSALGAQDAGPLAGSTPLHLTFNLALTPDQRTDLDRLLAAQLDRSSAQFRHWLTPDQFSARFGASEATLAALRSWLGSRGLSVATVEPSRRRLTVIGNAATVEQAFGISMHSFRTTSGDLFAPRVAATLPDEIAPLLDSISGLDSLTTPAALRISISTGIPLQRSRLSPALNGTAASDPAGFTATENQPDPLDELSTAVAANSSAVITLISSACSNALDTASIDAYRALLEQAAAQGITMLSSSSCEETAAFPAFPAALSNALAFAESPRNPAAVLSGVDQRPSWQVAPGLPSDSFRKEPDLAVSSGAALATTLHTLISQAGTRLGNINGTLYTLSKSPGLYTHIDGAPAGTWEPSSGLGTMSLEKLLKAFPRISGIRTSTSLISSTYAVNYGNPFTLTSSVQVTGVIPNNTTPYPPAPTGVITFTASTQGVLGTASIDGSGTATLDSGVLPVGTYVLTAAYSGDSYYAPSTSTSNVTITVSLVSAKLSATASPSSNVPYGAAATVTATVTLPGSSAAPTGPVTAQISSGTPVSATLSPNPGSNSATANIDVSVPPPGSYNVHVTCQGTTNFQCQTPVNIPITVVKGYTNTNVSVTPAAPQAGQPISLTATVVNSGNGTSSYTYGGSITFYDSGKLIATAPVATNQATTTTTLSGNRTHNIIAVYTGDSNWITSTSGAVAVTPTILPDALTLSSNVSGNSSLAGVNIIFTGTVTTTITYDSGPTGTVTFFDTFNGAVVQLGNPSTLVANGSAASIALFTTTGLQPGTHRIYVQYSGDDNYGPATSAVVTLSLSDFSVTMTPASLTVSQGKSAQVSVLVANSGGFSGTVSLGCTPPSGSGATCSFSPAAVTGAGASTLTIVTAAAQVARNVPAPRPGQSWSCAAGAALAGLFCFIIPSGRRRRISLLAGIAAATLAGTLGCGTGLVSSSGSGSGSGGGTVSSDPGTPLGTQNYTITVSGSDGVNTVRHTLQYQVTVQ